MAGAVRGLFGATVQPETPGLIVERRAAFAVGAAGDVVQRLPGRACVFVQRGARDRRRRGRRRRARTPRRSAARRGSCRRACTSAARVWFCLPCSWFRIPGGRVVHGHARVGVGVGRRRRRRRACPAQPTDDQSGGDCCQAGRGEDRAAAAAAGAVAVPDRLAAAFHMLPSAPRAISAACRRPRRRAARRPEIRDAPRACRQPSRGSRHRRPTR